MTISRTRVGIVEWGRRARVACATELAAGDALGQLVSTTTDLRERLALVARARRHAWRAEEWDSVVPVLHDVEIGADDVIADVQVADALERLRRAPSAAEALAADRALADATVALWARWADDARPVADIPYLRVVERTTHDVAAQAG
jgi:hypothetical protein